MARTNLAWFGAISGNLPGIGEGNGSSRSATYSYSKWGPCLLRAFSDSVICGKHASMALSSLSCTTTSVYTYSSFYTQWCAASSSPWPMTYLLLIFKLRATAISLNSANQAPCCQSTWRISRSIALSFMQHGSCHEQNNWHFSSWSIVQGHQAQIQSNAMADHQLNADEDDNATKSPTHWLEPPANSESMFRTVSMKTMA